MAWPTAPLPLLLAQNGDAPAAAKTAAPAITVAPAGKTVARPAVPAPTAQPESSLPIMVMIGPMILLFYLLVLRPQQKQEKDRKALISAIKKNDKVLTSAGIYGTVMSIDADTDRVVLRVDDDKGIRLTFSKASILRVVEAKPEKTAELSS